MNLPIVKLTKYDLLMGNISPTLEKECLVVFEDTDEIMHWELNKYIDDMWANASIDRYIKLINQMNCNKNNVGYTVDINGRIKSPYENTGYSDHTTTSSYKYISCGGSTCSYSDSRVSLAYLSDDLIVDGKHTLCLACGRPTHTPKIGKYNDRYCENCGCYMPEIISGGDL